MEAVVHTQHTYETRDSEFVRARVLPRVWCGRWPDTEEGVKKSVGRAST